MVGGWASPNGRDKLSLRVDGRDGYMRVGGGGACIISQWSFKSTGNGRCEDNETERKRWLVELSGQRQEYAKEEHTQHHRDWHGL